MATTPSTKRSSVVVEIFLFILTISSVLMLVINEIFHIQIAPEILLLIAGAILLGLYFFWVKFYVSLVSGCILTSVGVTIVLAPLLGPPLHEVAKRLGGRPQWEKQYWPLHFVGLGVALLVIYSVYIRQHSKMRDEPSPQEWPKLPAWLLLVSGLVFTLETAFAERTRSVLILVVTTSLLLYRGIRRLIEVQRELEPG